jgi:hypothetical protein
VGAKSKRGRPKKAPAKVSRLNSKLDVLEFLASVYQDESLPTEVRIKAAIAFAPYRYPKLQAQHVTQGSAGQSHAEWVKQMAKALRESDEPELKLINASATEVEDAAIMPLDRARKENKG